MTSAATIAVSRQPISTIIVASTGAARPPAPLPVETRPIARPRWRLNQFISAALNGVNDPRLCPNAITRLAA